MDKIYLYDGADLDVLLKNTKSAILSFSETPMMTDTLLKRAESVDGGVSQIKRWISTSSFSLIVIEDLSSAFRDRDVSQFLFWLKDHAEDFGGPFIVIKESVSLDAVRKISRKVDSIEEILLNIR